MWRQSPLLLLTGVALITTLVMGGGTRQGSAIDIVPLAVSLPLLFFAAPRAFGLLRTNPFALLMLLGILGVPLLQLIPLPPSVWAMLPGRESLQELSAAIGDANAWRPISVSPEMTMRAFLALLAPLSIFLAAMSLDIKARITLVYICISIAVLSVFVATLQVYGGASSSLYFFEFTIIGRGVGFFANPNHQATFLYAVLPLVAATLAKSGLRLPVHPLIILVCIASTFALGLSMTGSRTALLLGLVSIGYVFLRARAVLADMPRRHFFWLAGGVVAVIAPLAGGAGLLALLRRFEEQDVLEDARWTIAAGTWRAAKEYLPFGSGMGTFVPVYQAHEQPQTLMIEEINRAHNDFLELLLEGGLPAAFLIACFLLWLAFRIWKLVANTEKQTPALEGAAALGLLLICLHSLWDYPLRTTAICSIFALLIAFLSPAPAAQEATVSKRHRRRRRSATRPSVPAV